VPSPEDGRRAVLGRIKDESQGRIDLRSYAKADGVEGEVAGMKTYALDFEAEIGFLEDCKWATELIGEECFVDPNTRVENVSRASE
jgi:hypothetical protein